MGNRREKRNCILHLKLVSNIEYSRFMPTWDLCGLPLTLYSMAFYSCPFNYLQEKLVHSMTCEVIKFFIAAMPACCT